MIDRLKVYWAARSEREQALLAIMFALLFAVILWFGVIAPLRNARVEAKDRLDRATVVSGRVSARADTLRRAIRTAPPSLGTSLKVAVETAATQAGFAPSRLDPQRDDRVDVVISSAKSQALFPWLATLAQRGIFVEKSAIRPNSDASLSFEATLRLRRP
jgi:general secretion pathway protein M